MLQPTPFIKDFVKGFEKLRLVGYLPTPHDVPTIGYGATGKGIYVGLVWTPEKAENRFEQDAAWYAVGVNRLLGAAAAQTTQNQFDALWSFAYNVGLDEDADTKAEGLGDSTLLRLHKAGDIAGAADQFRLWNKQNGKVLRGLTRRRAAEAAIYRGERV